MRSSPKPEQDEFDPLSLELLGKIAPVAPRSENAVRAGRAAFLEQALIIKNALPVQSTLSPSRPSFLKRKWLFGLNPILSTLIIVSLILGSTTTTVYASQNSSPDHFLYPVKIASEDLRLSLASSSKDKVGMDIEFANRRLQEVNTLTLQKKVVPSSVTARWGLHVDDLFEHSQQLSDSQMAQILLELQSGLKQQVQTTSQLTAEQPDDHNLSRLHLEVQAGLNLVELGISDQAVFRQQIKTAGGKEIENEIESMGGKAGGINVPQDTPTPTSTIEAEQTNTPYATLENEAKTSLSPTLQPQSSGEEPAQNSESGQSPSSEPKNSGDTENKKGSDSGSGDKSESSSGGSHD